MEKKTWLRNDITPYEIYLKTLYEFFKEEINSDKDLLGDDLLPDGYMKLQYQLDAVVQARKILETYNGVFISDVVGLGKTYICAMLAKALPKGKKLIICPPVLVDYWKEVLLEFDVAAEVESLGKLEKILDKGVDKFKYILLMKHIDLEIREQKALVIFIRYAMVKRWFLFLPHLLTIILVILKINCIYSSLSMTVQLSD